MLSTAYRYDKGIDYAFRPTNLSYSTLKMKGHKFIGRYIDGTVATAKPSAKCITKAELDAITAARLGIVFIFEKSTTRPIPGSVGQAQTNGFADGTAATNDMLFLGIPASTPIIVAAGDTDITASNLDQAVAYWQGFDSTCPHPLGVYGDYDLLDALKASATILWQANARGWSNSRLHPSAHVIQTSTYNKYDGNLVLRNTAFYTSVDTSQLPTGYKYTLFDPINKRWGSYPWKQNLPKLSRGSVGEPVKYLQGVLRSTVDITLPVTGTFGAQTYAATVKFQSAYRTAPYDGANNSTYMTADGIVGNQTWGVINNVAMGM